jgi:hypothetical protein
MDDWQKEWIKFWETAVEDAEQFFLEMSREMGEALEALIDFSDEMAEQLHEAIAPSFNQLDEQISQWIEPFAQTFLPPDLSPPEQFFPEIEEFNPPNSQFSPHPHPVCVGCCHYHGQIYGGNLLVCAMHPYGVEEGVEICPDKETAPWIPPAIPPHDFFGDDF